MSRRVVVGHQPQLFPYMGILNKIAKADVYIIVDHVQFVRHYFHNRTYIKANNAQLLLTVPVRAKGGAFPALNEVRIDWDGRWMDKLLKTLRLAYAKAPYFNQHYRSVEASFLKRPERLVDLTSELLLYVLDQFELAKEIHFSSALGVSSGKTQLLVDLARAVKGTTYMSGAGAHAYFDEAVFSSSGLEHVFNRFEHPRYPQLGREFLEGMGCIDLLFNCGKDGRRYILGEE